MAVGLQRLCRADAGRPSQRGTSLLELTVAMGISGILSIVGLSQWDMGHIELAAAQNELTASLDQAFVLARARGTNVTIGLASGKDANNLPIHLCRKVKWGKPANIPLPPGMDDPVKATATGEAHATITVTPRHTATASCWFLNDGKDALCMRLSNHGHVRMLRWRAATRRWAGA